MLCIVCRLFGSSCGLYPLDAIELVLAIKHLQILPNVSWGAKLPQLRTTAPKELNLKQNFFKNMFFLLSKSIVTQTCWLPELEGTLEIMWSKPYILQVRKIRAIEGHLRQLRA